MKKPYVLNPRNGKIHIVGYCHLTKPYPKEWISFATEDEARASYGGQSSGICKLCLIQREININKEKY